MTADRSEWFKRKGIGPVTSLTVNIQFARNIPYIKVFRAEHWKQSKQKEIICHQKYPVFTLSC